MKKKAKVKPKKPAPRKAKTPDEDDDLFGEDDALPSNVVSSHRPKVSGRSSLVIDGLRAFGITGIFMTAGNFALESRLSVQFVNSRIRAGSLVGRRGPDGQSLFRMYDLLAACFPKTKGRAPDTNQMTETARRAHWAAELDAIRVQEEMADLIRREDAEKTYVELCRAFISFFDALPGHITRDCPVDAAILARIESAIGPVRQRFHAHMQKGIGKKASN